MGEFLFFYKKISYKYFNKLHYFVSHRPIHSRNSNIQQTQVNSQLSAMMIKVIITKISKNHFKLSLSFVAVGGGDAAVGYLCITKTF